MIVETQSYILSWRWQMIIKKSKSNRNVFTRMYSQVSYETLPFLERQLPLFSLVLHSTHAVAENCIQEVTKRVEPN